jgi:hypothetical protein
MDFLVIKKFDKNVGYLGVKPADGNENKDIDCDGDQG